MRVAALRTAAAAVRAASSQAAAPAAAAAGAHAIVPSSGGLTAEEMERRFLVPTYNGDGVRTMPGLVIERGEGSYLIDRAGRRYLDWAAGIAVNALGHSEPGWVAAVAAQAGKIAHTSNLFHTAEPLQLAQAMVQRSKHFDKVFFCNSGTEANEAALKFARKHALVQLWKERGLAKDAASVPPTDFGCKKTPPSECATQGGTCPCWPQAAGGKLGSEGLRTEIIAFDHSFHGRSMGALSMTHKPAIRQPYAPFPGDVKFARFNALDDVRSRISKRTAAVIVEPVQGEGGIFSADPDFMRGLRQLCTDAGALLIVDEVQCGLGRTGHLWAHEAYDVKPDILTVAKPLAGGLPIGAVMTTDAVSSCIVPGDHGTTYGGNPFVAAAALYTFNRIADPAFLEHSRKRGEQLAQGVRALQSRYPSLFSEVRTTPGGGLFVGLQVTTNPKPLVKSAASHGLLIITAGTDVIRICPPLTISAAEIEEGLRKLELAVADAFPQAKRST